MDSNFADLFIDGILNDARIRNMFMDSSLTTQEQEQLHQDVLGVIREAEEIRGTRFIWDHDVIVIDDDSDNEDNQEEEDEGDDDSTDRDSMATSDTDDDSVVFLRVFTPKPAQSTTEGVASED